MERLIGRREQEQGSYTSQKSIGYCKITFLEMAGIHQAAFLTKVDHFKITFLGKPKL